MNISEDRYEEIARRIASDDSPVGIDAERTHVWILDLLLRMEARLERIEERIGDERPATGPPI